ncbi:hypothetical protein WA026_021366 [Henosepilachna vigintioctopunctata]|uniref:Proton-coupled folate transporter n=1 Tax=Henosepilachna vigintioctopunctata TaxID=420089 RepID=A0AAW1TNN2_9CUCU
MARIQEGSDQRTTEDVRSGAKHITRRILLISSKISVEPTVFLTMFTSIMYQLITQNLYLEKSCRVNIGFNSSICNALSHKNSSGYSKSEEVEVQKLVSQMLALRTALQSIFPVCLILFIGSWSDRNNRRKPVILAPIFGEIMCCGFLILNVVFFYELPLIFTTLGDSLPLSLLGGWPCLFVGVYTFIGTRCSKENRTIRVGIVSASKMAAYSLGLASAGLIYRAFGFIGFFSLCIALLLMALTLAMLLIKDEGIKIEPKKEIGPLKIFSIFDISKNFQNKFQKWS